MYNLAHSPVLSITKESCYWAQTRVTGQRPGAARLKALTLAVVMFHQAGIPLGAAHPGHTETTGLPLNQTSPLSRRILTWLSIRRTSRRTGRKSKTALLERWRSRPSGPRPPGVKGRQVRARILVRMGAELSLKRLPVSYLVVGDVFVTSPPLGGRASARSGPSMELRVESL